MAQIKITGVKKERVKNFAHFYCSGSKVYQRKGYVMVSIKEDTNPVKAQHLVERLINKANAASIEVVRQKA